MRRLLSTILAIVFVVGCCSMAMVASAESDQGYISNADVTPKYVPNSQVKLEKNSNGLVSPDWIKTLLIEEINVTYASDNGMFSGMDRALDHLEEMGVNGIWLTPINAPSQYLNYGPHTVNPSLTGTDDYEKGWKIVAEFVEKAHKRNIRVFFDIVTWGVSQAAPMVKEHRDWFKGIDPTYNGYNYDWSKEEVVSWFSNQLVSMIEKTNADGFRADTGVNYCGYEVYRRTRKTLYDKGYYVCMFPEGATERYDVFDFEECGTIDAHFRDFAGTLFTETYNILDSVKKGTGFGTTNQVMTMTSGMDRYYTATLSHHDAHDYDVTGDIIKMGYSGILSPYIPLWYIGDEWDNPHVSADGNSWLFGTAINWNMREQHRKYYEQVKLLIRIRRVYSDIFESFAQNHREANICAVETDHEDAIQAYARYAGDTAVLVVPNKFDTDSDWTVTVPFDEMGLKAVDEYVVTDLLTGEELARGSADEVQNFAAAINRRELGVFAVGPAKAAVNEQPGAPATPDDNNDSNVTPDEPIYTPDDNGDVTVDEPDDSAVTPDDSDVSVDEPDDSDATSSTDKTDPVPTKAPSNVPTTSGGLQPIAIVGIVAGAVVVVGGAAAAAVVVVKKRKKK